MKTILTILLVASASVLAQDLASTVSTVTNKNRTMSTDAFTRAGITNLVRRTYSRDGKVQLVRQEVYRGTNVALELIEMDNGLTCSAIAGSDSHVATHFSPSGRLDSVSIATKDMVILDLFTVTNGLLYPIPTTDITKANEIGKDVGALIRNVTNSTPEAFGEQAVELIKKYKKE